MEIYNNDMGNNQDPNKKQDQQGSTTTNMANSGSDNTNRPGRKSDSDDSNR